MSHHAGSSCSCSSLMSIADTLDCAAQVAVPVKTLQQGSAVQDYALHDPHDKTRIVCRLQVHSFFRSLHAGQHSVFLHKLSAVLN